MDALAKVIFDSLRQMDREAGIRPDGKRTGIWWYGGHARPELRRPQTEVEWSRRLRVLLASAGYPTDREVSYPSMSRSRRTRCDLVIELETGERLWLEVKGAWKDYWSANGGLGIFRSYLLEPLVADACTGKTHTVPLDLRKLEALHPPDADFVGELLVGFDESGAPIDGDVGDLVRLAGLDRSPWRAWRDRWTDPHHPETGVSAWLWCRPAAPASAS